MADNEKVSFDEYCEEHDIKDEELGEAFAAYLNYLTDGAWDGESHRVE